MLDHASSYNPIVSIKYAVIALILADINTHHRNSLRIHFCFQIITSFSFEAERFSQRPLCWQRIGADRPKAVPDRLKERIPYETTA